MKYFKKIYLQFKNYDGTEATETEITWSPVRVNDSDVEYVLSIKQSEVGNEKIEICQFTDDTFEQCPNWRSFTSGCADCIRYKLKDKLMKG